MLAMVDRCSYICIRFGGLYVDIGTKATALSSKLS